MAAHVEIPALIDPCPTCAAPLLVICGTIRSPRVELFSVGGPPAAGGSAHVRAHTADCADRSSSDANPGTSPHRPPVRADHRMGDDNVE